MEQHLNLELVDLKDLIQSFPQLHLKAEVLEAPVKLLAQLAGATEGREVAAALAIRPDHVVERLHPDKGKMVVMVLTAVVQVEAVVQDLSGQTVLMDHRPQEAVG